jgi:glycine/D-amino acid oxidase-like deaminating enzyme
VPTAADLNTPAWADNLTASPLTAFSGEAQADVCVVGLGGSGLACVHELLRRGQRVIGLDARTVGCGAAGSNGGFLLAGSAAFYHDAVAALGRDRARAIYQLTLDELDRMSAETPTVIRRGGSLRVASSEAEQRDCDLQYAAMRADGFAVEAYDGNEGRGLLFPADGSFNPLARCRILAQRAIERGASLYEHSRVTSLASKEVLTASGRIRCQHVIVAVDGNLDRIFPELAGRVRTARLQMLSTGPVADVRIPRPVYSRWGYDYWQQLPDSRIVIGGCRDRFENAEWTSNAEPSEEVQRCLDTILRKRLGVAQPVQHRWAASVGYTNGVLPIFEQVRPDVWAIGGYNGTGNVIGALCGRMVAELVVTGELRAPAPFAPDTTAMQ